MALRHDSLGQARSPLVLFAIPHQVQGIKRYSAKDFAFGSRFADVMRLDKNNEPVVDFERFHELVPLRTNNDGEVASPVPRDSVTAAVCF